jgi:hypothetical protein
MDNIVIKTDFLVQQKKVFKHFILLSMIFIVPQETKYRLLLMDNISSMDLTAKENPPLSNTYKVYANYK